MTQMEQLKELAKLLFQYRKRYEVTCDGAANRVEVETLYDVSIPQAV